MKSIFCSLIILSALFSKSYAQCGTNIALGKTVLFSSEDPNHYAARVVDNNGSDWWPNGGWDGPANQYLTIDLGTNRAICNVSIDFYDGVHHAASYSIQTSTDNATWTTHANITGNTTVNVSHNITANVRYVKLNMTQKPNTWSTYSVSEFKVYSNQPPTASITSPANNASFTAGSNITIDATATDADGTISKVEFYKGAEKLGEDAVSPFSYTWTNVSAGSYVLTAVATDNGTLTTTSTAVNITVTGGTPANAWLLTGNAGTTAGTNFLGTTDNVDLVLKTNNTEKLRLLSNGNMGLGVAAPTALLDVNGLSRFRNHLTVNAGTANRTAQLRDNGLYISRTSDGGYASTITGDGAMTLSSRNGFLFLADAVNVATLTETGNLGLGTTVPSAKLSFGDLNTITGPSGITWYNSNPFQYAIHKTDGAWSGPDYQQLKVSWLTGVIIDPGQTYGKSFVDIQGNGLRVTGTSVGIGVTNPTAQLHTTGLVRFAGIANNNALTRVVVSDANGNLAYRDAATLGGGTAGWVPGGNAVASAVTLGTTSNYSLPFITNNVERMRIGANGNVGIGTTNINDATYKLFVEGSIRTRKVRVDAIAWPDYVFDKKYTLLPITEVEKYIEEHHHLPEVPSAAEVQKKGLDLGDNQATLLKKIEELTLYLIEQNKRMEAQEKQLQEGNKRAERLEKELQVLKKSLPKK